MITVIKGRQAGKTTELIKMSAERGGYIVCHSRAAVRDVVEQSKALGLLIPYPLAFYEFMAGKYYGKNIKEFYIDNIELCLVQASPVPVAAISLTPNPESHE